MFKPWLERGGNKLNTKLSLLHDLEVKSYTNGNVNKLDMNDSPFHQWYRFVLSFPPHLVRVYKKISIKTRRYYIRSVLWNWYNCIRVEIKPS